MSTDAGQPSHKPSDSIPGWYRRLGPPQLREAVRVTMPDHFPLDFLRSDEFVSPAKPPQLGVTIGRVGWDMKLAVPPGYWIVRDEGGEIRNWRDDEFKVQWARSGKPWSTAASREPFDLNATLYHGNTLVDNPHLSAEAAEKAAKKLAASEHDASLGLPRILIVTADRREYPGFLIGRADLIIQDGVVVKDRRGAASRAATQDELGSAMVLTPEQAVALVEERAWRNSVPGEGSRRALVHDAIMASNVLSYSEAREIADDVEAALRGMRELDTDGRGPGPESDVEPMPGNLRGDEEAIWHESRFDQYRFLLGRLSDERSLRQREINDREPEDETADGPDCLTLRKQLGEKREEAWGMHRILDELGVPKGPEISPPTPLNRLRELQRRLLADVELPHCPWGSERPEEGHCGHHNCPFHDRDAGGPQHKGGSIRRVDDEHESEVPPDAEIIAKDGASIGDLHVVVGAEDGVPYLPLAELEYLFASLLEDITDRQAKKKRAADVVAENRDKEPQPGEIREISNEEFAKVEVDKGLNHLRHAFVAWLGL